MSEMNYGLQQNVKQTQELKLTPEMVQSIRILQMNQLELAAYVSQELTENPVLEEAAPQSEDMSAEELQGRIQDAEEDWVDRYEAYDRYDRRSHLEERGSGNGGAADYEKFVRQEDTLQDYLMNQLQGCRVTKDVRRACEYMIGSLDDDGYLLLEKEELMRECQVTPETAEEALTLLQSMDPAGVGCRNLRECLQLQLQMKGLLTEPMAAMIDDMLEDVAANRIGRIAKALGVPKTKVQEMVNTVRTLEPKPGRRFSDGRAVPYIVPDVIIEWVSTDGELQVYINDAGTPRIRVSAYYQDILKARNTDEELTTYLSDRFKAANYLIQNIQQRNQTILRIVMAIMDHQKQFFMPGNKLLRPLTMQEIADELGVHVSTVSRAIDGKYMQCDGHIYSLRHFFGGGVAMRVSEANPVGAVDAANMTGVGGTGKAVNAREIADAGNDGMENVSATSVRQMIRELIHREDPSHPLSDQRISDMLMANGVKISRRTVTKYRENEGIDAASRRRR